MLSDVAIRVAPSCLAVLQEANRLFPNRSKASDGTVGDARHRASISDHNPTAEGWVTAVDLTHDPAHGCDAHQWVRDVANRRDPRVKYLISQGQICSSYAARGFLPWTWRPYSGSNRHDRHAHVSVHDTPTSRNDTSSWFRAAKPVPAPPATFPVVPFRMEARVFTFLLVTLGPDGSGWKHWDPGFAPAAYGVSRQGPNPAGMTKAGEGTAKRDGFWYANGGGGDPTPSVQVADGLVIVSAEGGKPGGVCGVYAWAAP